MKIVLKPGQKRPFVYFLHRNITTSCSKQCMCATELSSFLIFLEKHLINCNTLLQLCHPATQLPTSSLASQLLLCLTKKNKKTQKTRCSLNRNNNTICMKSVIQHLQLTPPKKSTKMTITNYLYLLFLSLLSVFPPAS